MADTANESGDVTQVERTATPEGSQHLNEQNNNAGPFPAGGFQGFYGYNVPDGSSGEGGQNPVPYYFPPGSPTHMFDPRFAMAAGIFSGPMGSGQTAFQISKAKRRQVKNACINCAQACKRCDSLRPCERCKKYGIPDSCVDSTRKERKKGVKRGPYKRRQKNGQTIHGRSQDPDGDWLPNGGDDDDEPPTTVDPADLPNTNTAQNQNSGHGGPGADPANQAFAAPDGYYTYPYPYPIPPPGEHGEGAPGFPPPPPHFFPHLHPAAYPPYPPWQPPFPTAGELVAQAHQNSTDVNASADGEGGGSARTSGKKKKVHTNAHAKKASEDMKAAANVKRHETAAARASRAARRRRDGKSDIENDHDHDLADSHDDGHEEDREAQLQAMVDLASVTDPSLMEDGHVNGDVMTMDSHDHEA